jgi:N-acetylglutamate synthase-like GNAT family acetyltransferase
MDTSSLLVRRATVDDLPQLIDLWRLERLPWEDLEKRLTEFQVADDGTGTVLGAVGVHLLARQAKIHSEVFLHWEMADALRARFWERIESLSHNHGLVRLWTQLTAPFWHGYGFQPPTAELVEKFPPAFGDSSGAWIVLTLRAEPNLAVDVDKEFAMFKEAEKARTEQAFKQARLVKIIATVLAVLLFVGVLVGMSYLFFKTQPPPRPK